MKYSYLIAALCLSLSAHADLLKLVNNSNNIDGVTLSTSATTSVNGTAYTLTEDGAAMRAKAIFGPISSNIYVGQLFVSDVSKYSKTVNGALTSLANEQAVVLMLNFVFSPPTSLVISDFQAAAKVNNIATTDADITAFINVINTLSFRNSGQFTMLFTKNADGTYTLSLEDKQSPTDTPAPIKPIALSSGGMHKILSLWLGVPADTLLGTFQTNLMQ